MLPRSVFSGGCSRKAGPLRSAAFAFMIFAFVFGFFAQRQAYAGVGGSISGTVTDQTGAVLPAATVKVTNPATGFTQTTLADAKGFYTFPSLPVGSYTLEFSLARFHTCRRPDVTLNVNDALVVDAI